MIPGLVVGGLLALFGLLPALALTQGQPADLNLQAAQIYVFERLRHHLAILHLPSEEMAWRIVRHGCLVAGFGFLWWWGSRSRAMAESKNATGISNQVETTERGTLSDGTRSGDTVPLRWRLLFAFTLVAIGIAVCGFAIEAVTWRFPTTAARLLRYYWFRITDFALPLSVAMLAGAVVADSLRRNGALGIVWLVVALGYSGWHLADLTYQRHLDPRPRGEIRLALGDDRERSQKAQAYWLDVCRWVRERTPPGTVVLTPRRSQTFKWRTGRAEVVTRKDIPQDAAGIIEWSRRLSTIHTYVDSEGDEQTFRSLAAARDRHIAALAEEFHFDFVLTRSRPVLRLPIVYRNRRYTVYKSPGHEE